jgi:LPS sulfotransferase NodH
LGFPLEYFTPLNRDLMCVRLGLGSRTPLPDYLAALLDIRVSPNGVFGFKLHHDELADFEAAGGLTLPQFEDLRVIHLERRDILSQAISLSIADQTNQWIDLSGYHMAGEGAPRYDRLVIQQLCVALEEQQQAWLSFLSARDIPILPVVYEDMIANTRGTFSAVCRFLEIPPVIPDMSSIAIRRQDDPIKRGWKDRYLSGR